MILAQKVHRLRVNRIAIVQTLKVEHVYPRLVQRRVLNENDKKLITSGRTAQDKTRLLLDLLPEKGIKGITIDGISAEKIMAQAP